MLVCDDSEEVSGKTEFKLFTCGSSTTSLWSLISSTTTARVTGSMWANYISTTTSSTARFNSSRWTVFMMAWVRTARMDFLISSVIMLLRWLQSRFMFQWLTEHWSKHRMRQVMVGHWEEMQKVEHDINIVSLD